MLVLYQTINQLGVSTEAYLAALKPQLAAQDYAALANPSNLGDIDVATFPILITTAIALTGEEGLAFHLGLHMKLSSHGFVGFAAMSAGTIGEALEIVVRFAQLRVPAISFLIQVEGESVKINLKHLIPQGNLREFFVVTLFIGLYHLGEVLTGVKLQGQAKVSFAMPSYFSRFKRYIPGEVAFEQPEDSVIFAKSYLELPIQMADPISMQLAKEQCERELALINQESKLLTHVRHVIYNDKDGFLSLDQVAAKLNLSSRTLKRQLADQGRQFSSVLEQCKHHKAIAMLANPNHRIEHIAEVLGYSDTANFGRAFKKWSGETPANYRKMQA